MKVFTINPNTGKYFEDKESNNNVLYEGIYKVLLIFPLYTFTSTIDIRNNTQKMIFSTLVEINNYLVEVNCEYYHNLFQLFDFNKVYNVFLTHCKNTKHFFNIKNL